MPSLYSVIKKSAPLCHLHENSPALYYNVQQLQFLCQQCLHTQQQSSHSQTRPQRYHTDIFTLQQIVDNPVLLMLKQGQFLSKIQPTNNLVPEFIKILTDIDFFLKSKKHSHQFTTQFLTHLKHQINHKIDTILQKVQHNSHLINEIQTKSKQLKNIKKDYSNQFLETLQTSFTNGTTQQLTELLKKYSIENENPFRKINQIVTEISHQVTKFTELNWNHIKLLQNKLLDPYAWSSDKIFIINQPTELQSLKQQNTILPFSPAYQLHFNTQNMLVQKYEYQDESFEKDHIQPNNDQSLFIQCTNTSIQLLTHKKHQHDQDEFEIIDKYQCQEGQQIDMLYELPQKMLLTVCYQGLVFYSYQFNKVSLLFSLSTIKGCNQVLIFENFCLVLAANSLYQINYHKLRKAVELDFDKNDSQIIQEMLYLFKDGKKQQHVVLLKLHDRNRSSQRLLELNLY